MGAGNRRGVVKRKSDEVRLALGLLQIARLAMPDTFFETDTRCIMARNVLKLNGINPQKLLEQP